MKTSALLQGIVAATSLLAVSTLMSEMNRPRPKAAEFDTQPIPSP